VAEWARLLSECRGNSVAGSNPAFPATNKAHSKTECALFSMHAQKTILRQRLDARIGYNASLLAALSQI
jgi:hypothetical protein